MLVPLLAAALAMTPPEEPRSVYQLAPAPDALVFAVSYGTSIALTAFASDLIHPTCPCDPATVNAVDRVAIGLHSDAAGTASDVTVSLAVVVPMILDGLHLGLRKPLLEDIVVFQEAIAVNTFFVELAKYTVQRPLPRTYAGDPSLVNSAGGYRSFYSGHTSTAFAALSVAAITAGKRGFSPAIAWTIAVLVGGSVGVERVLAGRHFWSDVATGALAGTAVGFAVSALHARGGLSVSAAPGSATIGWSAAF